MWQAALPASPPDPDIGSGGAKRSPFCKSRGALRLRSPPLPKSRGQAPCGMVGACLRSIGEPRRLWGRCTRTDLKHTVTSCNAGAIVAADGTAMVLITWKDPRSVLFAARPRCVRSLP